MKFLLTVVLDKFPQGTEKFYLRLDNVSKLYSIESRKKCQQHVLPVKVKKMSYLENRKY